MDAPETKVNVEEKGGVAILRYEGDITSFSEAAVLGTFRGLPREDYPKILLDFSNVEYINSSGIALIITMLMEAGKSEQKIVCFGLTPHFQKVFEMVGLKKYTSLHATEEEGLAALRE
jgi:anti-sigma B factor antagonist